MYERKLYRNIDYSIILAVMAIAVYGFVAIAVATAPSTFTGTGITAVLKYFKLYYVRFQILWFIIGIAVMIVIMAIDYHVICDLSNYIYWINVVLLLLVFVAGHASHGVKSWLTIAGKRGFQPSEFAKIAIIITLAKMLSNFEDEKITTFKQLIPIIIHFGIPFVLIAAQPDAGTAFVYIVILLCMLFIGGISYKILFSILGAGVACLPAVWFILKPYQRGRILTFLDPSRDPTGKGFNVIQSKIAIGSGQLYGKNVLQHGVNQLVYVPERSTDFIFSAAAESLGFIGAVILIILYLFLIFRALSAAKNSRDKLGSLIVIGVVSLLLAHIFENIGMTMGLMPCTGIPLPFMSYGGSNMLTNMIAIGLVLNVGMRRQKIKF